MQIIHDSLGNDTQAYLQGFLHETDSENADQTFPAIIVVPGGSYTHIPEQQSETLAMAFYNMGYQAFYLRYSFVDEKQPLLPYPVIELAKAVAHVRASASEWQLEPEQLVLAGFSVGGHIVSLYNDYWHTDWLAEAAETENINLTPQATILGYPVISPALGFPADNVLAKWTNTPDEIAADQHVSSQNAPTFIWVTADDPLVPVANSLAYTTALNNAGVPYELHVFHHGPHGLALANHMTAWKRDADQPHVAHWLGLAEEWLNEVL